MAIKKQIDISVDARSAIKDMDELGSSFEDVFGEIKPLNTKIGEMEDALYQLASAGDTSSKEFKDLSRQIGDYKKVIIDTDLKIDGMAQTTAQNLGGALGGVTAGFELGTGAMGAFGVESDKVQAALLRVQSAMAISQGIQGIRESIPSFRKMGDAIQNNEKVQKLFNFAVGGGTKAIKLMRVALVSLGIGALIVAVGALIANFDKLKNMLFGVTKAQETMNEITSKAVDAISEELSASDKLQKLLKDETVTREEKFQAVKKLQEQYPDLLGNLDVEKSSLREINKALILNTQLALNKAKQDAIASLRAEEFAKQIKEQVKAQTGQNKSLIDVLQGISLFTDAQDIANKKTLLAIKNSNDLVKGYDDINETLKEEEKLINKTIDAHNFSTRKKIDNNKKVTQSTKQEEEEIGTLEFRKVEAFKQSSNEIVQAKKEEVKQRIEAERGFHAASAEMRRISQSKEFAMTEKGLGNAMTALNSLQALSDAVTDNELAKAGDDEEKKEKIRKKAFERNKKLQITMAIVQGIQGVMAAFTAGSSMGPAGVVMGPLMAALAAATAVINVAKIKNTKYQSSTTPNPAVGGGGGAPPVPQFNVVGAGSENQLAQALGEQQQQPVQAYVVAGDVTTAQSLERDKIELSGL
tara:strand:+ start:6482 stop:8401 length:1920 start_codon:yes stop_codon:yes gene_type:complete